jgi:pimeloyl-ACP methyl ester carboxylesterase
MKISIIFIVTLLGFIVGPSISQSAPEVVQPKDGDFVVLLHGMKRSASSMGEIENNLRANGYRTINIDYPSSEKTIEELSDFIHREITLNYFDKSRKINFVTHSMGGILTRYYLKKHRPDMLGRVVMLAPPNQGTEMSDFLQGTKVFEWFFGPAGTQLGTNEKSIVNSLGPVDYELGVVMGNISLNPIASVVVPGDDDGLVSHERSKVEGMKDSIILPTAHSLIMFNKQAHEQIVHFLQDGKFSKEIEN